MKVSIRAGEAYRGVRTLSDFFDDLIKFVVFIILLEIMVILGVYLEAMP